jgi:hypothetical protein
MKTTLDIKRETEIATTLKDDEGIIKDLMHMFKCDKKRAQELFKLGHKQGYLIHENRRLTFKKHDDTEIKEASLAYLQGLEKESSWCDFFTQDLIKIKKPHQKAFIETGTASGFSAKAAMRAGFSSVDTVEINGYFCEYAAKVLWEDADHPDWKDKVTILQGSSVDVLPVIFEKKTEPFVLWLDAHWSGGPHIGENMGSYLPKELAAIAKCNVDFTECSILIDDMNHFINDKAFLDLIIILLQAIKPNGKVGLYDSPSGHTFMISQ